MVGMINDTGTGTRARPLPSPGELRDLCTSIVSEAARLVARQRAAYVAGGEGIPRETKSSEVDPVTAVDRAAEQLIVARLGELRPRDGILGEEGADKPSLTGVQWIVDPIDGTVNFLYGLPAYAISVAAAVEGVVVAGAVQNVATGELYSAALGEGATVFRGGRVTPLQASAETETARALVATGFSYSSAWRARQAEILAGVLPEVRDIRRMGSAALDLCAVAEGRVDAYYEHGTHPWDWAAGAIIAAEAGVVVHHPGVESKGEEGEIVTAGAPGVAATFSELLGVAGALSPLAR